MDTLQNSASISYLLPVRSMTFAVGIQSRTDCAYWYDGL